MRSDQIHSRGGKKSSKHMTEGSWLKGDGEANHDRKSQINPELLNVSKEGSL